MAGTAPTAPGADLISAAAGMTSEQRAERLGVLFSMKAAVEAEMAAILGEVDRSQSFRDEGATSTEAWVVERYGVSLPSARALARVGAKVWDLPHLTGSMYVGDISFDKVRVLADVATPETDRELRDRARQHSVRELADIARTASAQARTTATLPSSSEQKGRSLHFNDDHRTISAQLPAESYAEAKACIEAWAHGIPSDGDTPLDQRHCDAFSAIVRSVSTGSPDGAAVGSSFFVVAHVPLDVLVDESGEPSGLAGELEHAGLLDVETVRRIACDATIVVAVDDEAGHTMYEGRAKRLATPTQRREVMRRDRHCRFPGCTNVAFAEVHHVVPWKPGGRTDLPNLALMCDHHHRLVHRDSWTMSGNPNEELTFVGPTGRVMVSRPSPLWTRVTHPA
jgi:Domain of unknown function (DUF222)/HNH endonuclease